MIMIKLNKLQFMSRSLNKSIHSDIQEFLRRLHTVRELFSVEQFVERENDSFG